MAAPTTAEERPFRLLDLPPELRLRIYDMAFAEMIRERDGKLDPARWLEDADFPLNTLTEYISLRLTCRLVKKEATDYFNKHSLPRLSLVMESPQALYDYCQRYIKGRPELKRERFICREQADWTSTGIPQPGSSAEQEARERAARFNNFRRLTAGRAPWSIGCPNPACRDPPDHPMKTGKYLCARCGRAQDVSLCGGGLLERYDFAVANPVFRFSVCYWPGSIKLYYEVRGTIRNLKWRRMLKAHRRGKAFLTAPPPYAKWEPQASADQAVDCKR